METIVEKKIKIARTRSGVPCLWESTMKFADLKRSTAIFSSVGESKPAVYINKEKEKQALVPIEVGDYITKAFEDKHGVALSVFRIIDVSPMENAAAIVPVYRKSSLIQEYAVPNEFVHMIDQCVNKLKDDTFVLSIMNYAATHNKVVNN
jgi:hypothetical protein